MGALNSGSITSGFTSIDVGSGAITTSGTLTGGILAVDNVQINGSNIGHTNDTDLLTVASGTLTVAGRVDLTTLAIGSTDITADATELNYVDGVTSSIQTQLDGKETTGAITRSASIDMADNVLQRPELKDYSETKVAMGANDVDLSAGNVFTKTISGAQTLTFSNPPATGKGGAFTLILTNGGSATITFPTSVDWAAATAPTLTAAGVDVLTFTTIDAGTIWYGIASGIGMA